MDNEEKNLTPSEGEPSSDTVRTEGAWARGPQDPFIDKEIERLEKQLSEEAALASGNAPPRENEFYSGELISGKNGMSAGVIALVLLVMVVAVVGFCAYFISRETGEPSDSGDRLHGIVAESSAENTSAETPGDRAEPNIILEIKEKPQLDSVYYEDDGVRLTTQGVAKFVGPSIVSVWCYERGNNYSFYAQGSGIIMSSDGYILTNAHVINDAYKVKITLQDGTEYEAEIIGFDERSDIGILRVSGVDDLVAADFGDSDSLELGEPVIAIGSPDGLSGSVTAGIVSGLDRQVDEEYSDIGFIQTDAAINPGNSGGALVNMFGQVVGITSSKYADVEFEGICFAIPMSYARDIIDDLIRQGYVSGRPLIGISFTPVSEVSARINDVVSGIFIREIKPDCDIANSGLEVGDIITHINGIHVFDVDGVNEAIKGMSPGDSCTATVYRKSIIGEVTYFDIEFLLMEATPD